MRYVFKLNSGYTGGANTLVEAAREMLNEMLSNGEITGVLYRGDFETGEIVASFTVDPRAIAEPNLLASLALSHETLSVTQ